VLSIVRPVLGRDLHCKFVSVVSPWSGSLLQSPHTEVEFHLRPVPQGYVTHVPLVRKTVRWTSTRVRPICGTYVSCARRV
jgi:hypothetical protein